MAKRTIVKLGDPILRAVADVVPKTAFSSESLKNLIRDLTETMKRSDGIGIASPQIGTGFRVAVINTKDRPLVIINPRIRSSSRTMEIAEEGCLSVPGVFGNVRRPKSVDVSFADVNGVEQSIHAVGFLARVLQHEIDHLNGILFIDRLDTPARERHP